MTAESEETPVDVEALADDYLEGVVSFDQILTEFGDAGVAFSELSSAVSRCADSYDEVRELHMAFARDSPKVNAWITRDLSRAIKNRVLRSSSSGRIYPLETLREVVTELDAYAVEGIETPSVTEQIDAILEVLYEKNWSGAHEIIDQLLSDVPEAHEDKDTTYLLARSRAALALCPDTTPGHTGHSEPADVIEARRFKAVTAPQNPLEDGCSSDEYIEKAAEEDYESREKRAYYTMAVHADPRESDALYEYLYLTAKNDLERVRHRKYENPSRGRLAITLLQLEVLKTRSEDEWTDPERSAWIDSYYHVCHGVLLSSAQYDSHKVTRPEADFEEAAEAYRNAATAIEPVNKQRMLKYLSKAYRHEANAVTDPGTIKKCHMNAKQALIELHTMFPEESVQELTQDLLRYHQFKTLEIDVYETFLERDFDSVYDLYLEYYTLGGEINQYTGESSLVELCYLLSEGVRTYQAGDYESSRYYFEESNAQYLSPRFDVCKTDLHAIACGVLCSGASEGAALRSVLNHNNPSLFDDPTGVDVVQVDTDALPIDLSEQETMP